MNCKLLIVLIAMAVVGLMNSQAEARERYCDDSQDEQGCENCCKYFLAGDGWQANLFKVREYLGKPIYKCFCNRDDALDKADAEAEAAALKKLDNERWCRNKYEVEDCAKCCKRNFPEEFKPTPLKVRNDERCYCVRNESA